MPFVHNKCDALDYELQSARSKTNSLTQQHKARDSNNSIPAFDE
jgi:hypothetical protein